MPQGSRQHHIDRGYTIGTLFLLIATCATILALISPLARGRLNEEFGVPQLVIVSLLGGLVLGFVGMIIGLFRYRKMIGVMQGILVGIFLGFMFGPLILIPADDFTMVISLGLAGAVCIVVVAAGIRLSRDDWEKPKSAARSPQGEQQERPKPHPLDPDPEEEDPFA
jgi:hypothetical protein